MTDYHNGQCAAITRAGKRCTGGWQSALPVLFSWDPITGVGVDGPHVVLCYRHRHYGDSKKRKRFLIVGGWLGAANAHGYGTSVYESAEGSAHSKEWLAHARPTTFDASPRKDCL